MTVKLSGAEWNSFYSNREFWPNDDTTWHDDEIITINGHEIDLDFDLTSVPNTAKMTISGGVVHLNDAEHEKCPSLELYFKQWRKKQTVAMLVVEVSHKNVDILRSAIVKAGGKIIS